MSELQPIPPPAFPAVYADTFDYVWRLLRRLGVREAELEDAAQEVFLVVYRKLAEFDPRRPLKPWLAGISHRVAAQERRRARHRRETLEDPQSLLADRADHAPSPEAATALAQRRRRVQKALDTLDMKRRAVFVMHELAGLSCPDVAQALQVPLNTVYSRLRVARHRFRASLDRLRLREGEV